MAKRKKKVKLPTDVNGTPINVGDWLMFSDGPFRVRDLVYFGHGRWDAEDDDGVYSDNIGNGTVVRFGKEGS
jgi:hypothetical protein